MVNIVKKDGTLEQYNKKKIINACKKSAERALDNLSENDYENICNHVWSYICEKYGNDSVVL